MTERE